MKEDRRVRKTKRSLKEGLSQLLLTKELRKITVKELTDKVDIHRATFYAHYQDIYDLYNQIEESFIADLRSIIANENVSSYEETFTLMVNYIYDNNAISTMLLSKNGNIRFYHDMNDFLEDMYTTSYLKTRKIDIPPDELLFFVKYHIHGCMAIFQYWAETNFSYPKDQLSKLIFSLDDKFDETIFEK